MKVAAVVPAYNEEGRIGYVLDTLSQSRSIHEIIAVSDGSTDATYEAAASHRDVRVLKLPENVGKGGAMLAGARCTGADVLVFLDADLIGLLPFHIDSLVQPVVDGTADMSIGIFRGGRRWTDWAQKIAPYISGQRALRREMFLSVPRLQDARYGVEIALTRYAKSLNLRIARVSFLGVTHPLKEEKLGLIKGAASRARMYREILKLAFHTPTDPSEDPAGNLHVERE